MKKVVIITAPQVSLTNPKVDTQEYSGLDYYFKEGYQIKEVYPFANSLMVVLEKERD